MIYPSLRQLRYFDAVARLGYFGKAAEACSVSQPALSMQIQELEELLGVVLIERGRKGVALTPEGVEIARRTGLILADIRDLVDHARHADGLLMGSLSFGMIRRSRPICCRFSCRCWVPNFPRWRCACVKPRRRVFWRNWPRASSTSP